MSNARREMKEALADAAGAEDPAGDHASADELAAYHAGTLPPQEEARLRDHLLRCEECTDLLLDLDALQNDPGFGGERPAPPAEIDAVWSRIRAHEQPRVSVPSAAPPAVRERPRSAVRWLPALAAALFAAVIGLSFEVAGLRRTLDSLSQPQLNAPVTDLTPGGPRSEGAGPVTLRLPASVHVFTLVLNPASPRDFPGYAVALEKADGGTLWSGDGLQKNPYGSFSLSLPRALVPDGTYTVRLFGKEGDHREPLGEYSFVITTP